MNKLLAIDDNQDNLIAISALLKNFMPACPVITSDSGPDGIEKVKLNDPDVILLDIKMPGMDGYETCEILKKNPSTKHIPVIMLTAMKTDAKARIKGLDSGADAFLTKPIDEAELIAQIRVMLRLKNTEKELRKERDELQKKTRELESFAYTVTHDLKAPLINLGLYSSYLLKNYSDNLDNKGMHYLKVLQKNVIRMEKFILDLLELSKAGRVLGNKEDVDIIELLNQIYDDFKPQLERKNIELIIPSTGPGLFCDREGTKQVFYNFISNAIKFMGDQKKPHIEVGFYNIENGYIHFYVKDNGIGIDNEQFNKVFQEFYRINDIDSEGTGIGLALVKKIINHHNGDVWVESNRGEGSIFNFTLPQGSTKVNTENHIYNI